MEVALHAEMMGESLGWWGQSTHVGKAEGRGLQRDSGAPPGMALGQVSALRAISDVECSLHSI